MGFVIKKQNVFSCSEQWLHKDESDQQRMNRQRESYCITKKDATCNMSNRKSLFKWVGFFELKTFLRTIKPQQKTTSFCFGSFVFSWPIVSNYLFVLFCFVLLLLLFSDKTTVQWYIIVGPLLAVTVLALIAFYLWKRRVGGTHTSSNKFFCFLNSSSQWKPPNMH